MSSIELVVVPDAEALAARAAEHIASAIASSERFRMALAGGSTPKRLYRKLAEDTSIDWTKVELYWGDERVVPPDHEKSNYRMVREALIDHIDIPEANVRRIEGERGAADAAAHYAQAIGDAPLDLVLLGMGGDGHTASIFPGATEGKGVVVTESPVPPTERVSLALDVINAAREALFLIAGEGKAERLAEVYAQFHDRPQLPAALVRPKRLCWLVDRGAASRLEGHDE